MKQLLIILQITAIFGFVACGKKEEVKETSKGKIERVIGEVSLIQNGKKSVAKKGDSILEGNIIQTGSKAVAIVEFSDNNGSVEIQENSEFVINQFNEKNQELISKSGSFWLNAKKIKKETNFQVVMPTSVAGIRGTKLYSFENKDAGITGICHCQGAVEFKENSSHYTGNHDSDFLVLTKGGKTIVITPEDFKQMGFKSEDDKNHAHSTLDDSSLGKKADMSDERHKKILEIAEKKWSAMK